MLRPALLAAYRTHFAEVNPIVDYPTWRMITHILLDEDDMPGLGRCGSGRLIGTRARSRPSRKRGAPSCSLSGGRRRHHGRRRAAGDDAAQPHGGRAARCPRFRLLPAAATNALRLRWTFVNPQRQVSLNENVPLDERTLALMCRRIVEMDVPEYMTRIIAIAKNEPWEYYVAMTRQLWDEVRHAMLGTIYFEEPWGSTGRQ